MLPIRHPNQNPSPRLTMSLGASNLNYPTILAPPDPIPTNEPPTINHEPMSFDSTSNIQFIPVASATPHAPSPAQRQRYVIPPGLASYPSSTVGSAQPPSVGPIGIPPTPPGLPHTISSLPPNTEATRIKHGAVHTLAPKRDNQPSTLSLDSSTEAVVSVEGGRYDVFLSQRQRRSVYWDEAPSEVRRASWFYNPPEESRVLPFSEDTCIELEKHYKETLETDSWSQSFQLPSEESPGANDTFVFHNPEARSPDDYRHAFRHQTDLMDRPQSFCHVKRGLDDQLLACVDSGESSTPSNLFFVIHGIGPIYNMKQEGLVECCNDLRRTSRSIASNHFPNQQGHLEFLPIQWYHKLHCESLGLDAQLERITLRSVPVLRNFTNRTLIDVLYYTSPKYAQIMIDAVSQEINRLHDIFQSRNPDFKGQFFIIGHSLGSVIAFDLLANQQQPRASIRQEEQERSNLRQSLTICLAKAGLTNQINIDQLMAATLSNNQSTSGAFWTDQQSNGGGFGHPQVRYPRLPFQASALFLFGSPLALFLTARGLDRLSTDFCLPTCARLFNIFHPFDPIAYRLETLIDQSFTDRAVLLPHHKGRKRLHLQLKENLARVGSDLKSKFYQSIQSTWRTIQEFAAAHNLYDTSDSTSNFDEGDDKPSTSAKQSLARFDQSSAISSGDKDGSAEDDDSEESTPTSFPSQLNCNQRIDYVLQEAPFESFSDYLFALSSHAMYWESEDIALFLLRQAHSPPTRASPVAGEVPLQRQPAFATFPPSTSTAYNKSSSPTTILADRSSVFVEKSAVELPSPSPSVLFEHQVALKQSESINERTVEPSLSLLDRAPLEESKPITTTLGVAVEKSVESSFEEIALKESTTAVLELDDDDNQSFEKLMKKTAPTPSVVGEGKDDEMLFNVDLHQPSFSTGINHPPTTMPTTGLLNLSLADSETSRQHASMRSSSLGPSSTDAKGNQLIVPPPSTQHLFSTSSPTLPLSSHHHQSCSRSSLVAPSSRTTPSPSLRQPFVPRF